MANLFFRPYSYFSVLISFPKRAGKLHIRALCFCKTCLTTVQTKSAHFKLFFSYSFNSVFFMTSDCSSYVMISLCIVLAYDCVTEKQRAIHSHMDTYKNTKLNGTQVGKFIFLLFLFCCLICIFLSFAMVTGRGRTSASSCKGKNKIWEMFLCLLLVVFVYFAFFPKRDR